jgi:hypothetical protein
MVGDDVPDVGSVISCHITQVELSEEPHIGSVPVAPPVTSVLEHIFEEGMLTEWSVHHAILVIGAVSVCRLVGCLEELFELGVSVTHGCLESTNLLLGLGLHDVPL